MAVVTTACPLAPSDEQLLACFAAGDRSVLDELFQRYRQLAYRVAYRLLGNEADALDAVQEGFVKALTHLDAFQGRSTFKTWLLRVVSNAALDLGRHRARKDGLRLDGMPSAQREHLAPQTREDPGEGGPGARGSRPRREHLDHPRRDGPARAACAG